MGPKRHPPISLYTVAQHKTVHIFTCFWRVVQGSVCARCVLTRLHDYGVWILWMSMSGSSIKKVGPISYLSPFPHVTFLNTDLNTLYGLLHVPLTLVILFSKFILHTDPPLPPFILIKDQFLTWSSPFWSTWQSACSRDLLFIICVLGLLGAAMPTWLLWGFWRSNSDPRACEVGTWPSETLPLQTVFRYEHQRMGCKRRAAQRKVQRGKSWGNDTLEECRRSCVDPRL